MQICVTGQEKVNRPMEILLWKMRMECIHIPCIVLWTWN